MRTVAATWMLTGDLVRRPVTESGVFMSFCVQCRHVIAYGRDPVMLAIAEAAHRCPTSATSALKKKPPMRARAS